MSRQMKSFADYFMQGYALGGKWQEEWQARQIAKEKNRIMSERNQAVDKRENAKLGLYGEQVRANAELARARAHAALNPKARGGGGGGGAAPSSADAEALRREAAERGIISAPPAAPAPAPQITVMGGTNDGGDVPNAPAPVEGGYGDGMAKGGMVRRRLRPQRVKRYAEGGIVGGMTLEQAMSYAPRLDDSPDKPDTSVQDATTKGYDAAAKAGEKREAAPDVRPVGPVGTGAGGAYTTADVPMLTAGAGFRRGGVVRNYAEGGAVGQDLTQGYDYKAAEKERETKQQQARTEQAIQTTYQAQEEEKSKAKGGGAAGGSDFSSAFAAASGSADGATGSGGDSTGGVSGTGGVGGSATGGAGGSAAAGTSGEAGSDGSGTYRRGGRVRRFQSGGRVMEAIDTGTSGPGSGYGYRAAPPARRY